MIQQSRVVGRGAGDGLPGVETQQVRRLWILATLLTVLLSLGALPAAVAGGSSVPEGCSAAPAPGAVVDCVVPGIDSLGTIDARVRIVFPTAYDGVTPLPVVYLLHGVGDTWKTWVANTDVATFAADEGAIVVMPDGGKSPEAGWYSDWVDGSRKWETFHTDVLVHWIDSNFATGGDGHRAVAGLSMGGFGALTYAGRHPGLFSAAASFSGLLDTQTAGPMTGEGYGLLHNYFGTPDSRTWGDPATSQDEWTKHNPTALARAGAFTSLAGNLWLTGGTGTPGGPAGDDPKNPGAYATEQAVWQTNQTFKEAALQSGTAFHDLTYLGGSHSWPYWQYSLHQVLPALISAIR